MDKVKYTPLTPISSDSQLRKAVNDIIANLSPLTGQHRVRENKAVTWLDLVAAGYEYSFDGNGDFVMPPPVKPEQPDMSTPPEVEGFRADSSFNYVTLSWEQPKYKNHSHVEIWRAEGFLKGGAPTTLDDAVFRAMSTSIVASDTVLPADIWRYWARNVSKEGVFGPWTSVDGLLVNVPASPSYIIDKISGEIREGDLYPALGDKINIAYDGYFANSARIDDNDITLASHTATLSSHGVAIQQQSQIITDQGRLINASYTVRIDTGNAVHGFGLMADGSTGRSDFLIRSDRFAICAPQQYDQNGKPIKDQNSFPFIVDVSNPASPKTLIRNAYIDKAFIESLVTGTLVADRVTGQTLVGTHIRGGDMAIGANFSVNTAGSATLLNAFFKGTAQSSNYAAGNAGWQIRNDGYAEFRQAVVRGTVYAEDGYFNGTVYAEKMVGGAYTKRNYSGQYHADNTDTNWRTALRVTVARAMSVVRKLEIFGTAGHFSITASVEGSGSGTLSRTTIGTYEVRIVRDGVVVEAQQQKSYSVTATSNPSSGPQSNTLTGGLDVSLVANVPFDSATHYYDLQFRLVYIGGDGGGTGSAGCNSADGSTAIMYIENGDLA